MGTLSSMRQAADEFDFHVLAILNMAYSPGEDWVAMHLSALVTERFTRDMARAVCRCLRERGLAEFHRGLWTDDGEPAGAGYAITPKGREVLAEMGKERLARYCFDIVEHLVRQRAFSDRTFGPGLHTEGVADHIVKELIEVSADPTDLAEWVDVIILAFDGATRCAQHLGLPMSSIAEGIVTKQAKNEARRWPDWRTADPNKAIEHVREA